VTRSVFNHRRSARTLISSDSFNRPGPAVGSTDGSGLIDPTAWTQQIGSWGVSTNLLTFNGPGTITALLTLPLLFADIDMQIALHIANVAGESAGLVFRYKDTSNYMFARITTATGLQLFKRVAGVNTQLGATVGGVPLVTTMRVVASGPVIQVYVGNLDVPLITQSSAANQGETIGGAYANNNNATSWDNWRAYTI